MSASRNGRNCGKGAAIRIITASQDMWSGKLSAGFVQLAAGTSWGVDGQITFNLDTIAAGDKFMLNGAYGDNAFVGGTAITNPATNNGWSAIASFQHMFSSTFSGAIDYTYLHTSGPGSVNSWAASGALVWSPVAGFTTKLRGAYTVAGTAAGTWKAQVLLSRTW